MPFVPNESQWYIADLVTEFSVEDDESQNRIVHVNIVLVLADSPEQAYQYSLELGDEYEDNYVNNEGDKVKVSFVGLRDLNVIHDDLKHGAELTYESYEVSDLNDQKTLVKQKPHLSVFRD